MRRTLTIGIALTVGALLACDRDDSAQQPPPRDEYPMPKQEKTAQPAEPAEPAASPRPSAAPRDPKLCVLELSGTTRPVPVFPTEDDLQGWAALWVTDAGPELLEPLFVASQGKHVEPGTRCVFIDRGSVTSQIKVLEGRRRGKTFWVRTEWTQGTPSVADGD